MKSHKCKLNFMIPKTNLAIGSTSFIGIMNQFHYMNNQFSLNLQPISLHVVNNFMIWYTYSQLHKINFMSCINFIWQRTVHHVTGSPSRSPRLALPKCRFTSLIQPWNMSAVIACTSSLIWPNISACFQLCNERPKKIQRQG